LRTEDGYIVGRCLNGEKAAFGFLVDKYREAVYALAYSKVRNFHDAEDITQEVFIKAYRKLHTLRRWENFMAWLHCITLNQCKNWLRKQSKSPESGPVEDHASQAIIRHSMDSYHDELSFRQLHEALDLLPEIHRQVLTLHYLGGMTVRDISNFLAKSPRTIARRLNEARVKLKAEMLGAVNTTFESQKLQVGFTLHTLESVKRIKIHPVSQTTIAPWGISAASVIALILFSISLAQPAQYPASPANTVLSANRRMGSMGTSPLDISQAYEVFLIPSGSVDGDDRGPDTASPMYNSHLALNGSMDSGETEWSKHEANPVLTSRESGVWDLEMGSPCVLFDGVEYKMWYTGADGVYSSIGYATSTDGVTWTKYHGNPVFTATGSGWESLYVGTPEVMIEDGEYKMWYGGCGESLHSIIGYATSKDGINWARHADNPVLDLGKSGAWDCMSVRQSDVLFNGSAYKMWYTGKDSAKTYRIGYATSRDGITWIKHSGNPVLDVGKYGEWDCQSVRTPDVLFDGIEYKMWYNGNNKNYRIGYATSPDGIVWTKHYDAPVLDLGPGASWDDRQVGSPAVLLNNGEYRMWYTGSDGTTVGRIGYATMPANGTCRNASMAQNGGGRSWNRYNNRESGKIEQTGAEYATSSEIVLLHQNYPNPFNPETWIPYQLREDADVVIRIYSVDGRIVRTLELGRKTAGSYISKTEAVYWDGRDEAGEQVASGVYFYRIRAGRFTDTKKMTIAR